MRTYSGILLATCLLAVSPAFAGNLTLENGQTSWHSTQCPKPNPPGSLMAATPETPGEDMNSLASQHNAYVDAVQNYMNCVSSEAENDQTLVNQTITANAQKAIADAQADADADLAVRKNQK